MFSNKMYDTLRWVAQYLLPGLATLYFALAAVWGLPYAEEVVGTIVAVDVFLGALLGISSARFNHNKDVDGYIAATSPVDIPQEEPISAWVLSDKAYKYVKWITIIALPAAGALYFTLSQLWGFPYGAEIVGTTAALTAFSGLLLGVSTNKFKKG